MYARRHCARHCFCFLDCYNCKHVGMACVTVELKYSLLQTGQNFSQALLGVTQPDTIVTIAWKRIFPLSL